MQDQIDEEMVIEIDDLWNKEADILVSEIMM